MKAYVGDGVYVEITEQGVVLTTEDGLRATNRIVLEPDVWMLLLLIVDRARSAQIAEGL